MIKRTLTVGCMIALACPSSAFAAPSAKKTVAEKSQVGKSETASKSTAAKANSAKPTTSKTIKSIVLKQTHYFLGTLTVYVSKSALRAESTGSYKFILVAKAPDWKISVYRNDDKSYYETSLKQFSESGLMSQYLIGMHSTHANGHTTKLKRTIADLPVMICRTPDALVEYIPLENVIAPECRTILFNMYRVPTGGGLPIKFVEKYSGKDWMTGVDETGNWKSMLATTESSVKECNDTMFDRPSTYKKVPSMQQVITGDSTRDNTSSGAAELLKMQH